MGKVLNFKRLNKDDFAADDRNMIDVLSNNMTPFLESVSNALNKGIDFDNLNQQYSTFEVSTASSVPVVQTQIKYTLKTRLKGIIVLSAQNIQDTTPITSAPFISYSVSNDLITINSIVGIPDNKKFRISVILVG